jgi:hypothetical protein
MVVDPANNQKIKTATQRSGEIVGPLSIDFRGNTVTMAWVLSLLLHRCDALAIVIVAIRRKFDSQLTGLI